MGEGDEKESETLRKSHGVGKENLGPRGEERWVRSKKKGIFS